MCCKLIPIPSSSSPHPGIELDCKVGQAKKLGSRRLRGDPVGEFIVPSNKIWALTSPTAAAAAALRAETISCHFMWQEETKAT